MQFLTVTTCFFVVATFYESVTAYERSSLLRGVPRMLRDSLITQEEFDENFDLVGPGMCYDSIFKTYDFVLFTQVFNGKVQQGKEPYLVCASLCLDDIGNDEDILAAFVGFDFDNTACYCNFDDGQNPNAVTSGSGVGPVVTNVGPDGSSGFASIGECYRYKPFGTASPTPAPNDP